ncbi:short chain dehydrogenase [Bisporella sp. PMI_857]|nr:short chain dehydrogenase [Bisporella sp. PMI_857]
MAHGNVLIIGANRGIGLHFVKIFTERNWNVFGTVRPQTREDLSFKDLVTTGATILDIDFTDETSISKAASTYGDKALDVLVNCAGVDVHPRPWEENSAEDMINKFRIMTVGPFLATKHFLPHLTRSESGKVVNISSDYASISGNDRGRCISYRIAKAALNQQTVTIAHELKAADSTITMIMLDPGDIPTRLSRGNGKTGIDESVRGMVEIIEKATIQDSGCFYKWTGETLPF